MSADRQLVIKILVIPIINHVFLLARSQSLGNHEFDDGVDGLVPFVDAAKYPVKLVLCHYGALDWNGIVTSRKKNT